MESNDKKLKKGEVYLNCRMKTATALKLVLEAVAKGKEDFYFAAFKNKERTETNHPVYKSQDVAIWKAEKKEKIEEDDDI